MKSYEVLRSRAAFLKAVRLFFDKRGVMEVDTPLISRYAPVDAHIDLFEVKGGFYLHSSPEYRMKSLLTEGSGDIYQLGHVYRSGEVGRLHNPEFTMIEWYRVKMSFHAFVQETLELCSLFIQNDDCEIITHTEAFQKYLGIDIEDVPLERLAKLAGRDDGGREELLNILWGLRIEPQLGKNRWSVVTAYPPSQAALAKIRDGYAERFEIYFDGIELANGYHELTDPVEQRRRLEEANDARVALGKQPLPIDRDFLRSLEKGLPDCYGVAVGFDRLLMLHLGATSVGGVLPA